MPHFDPSVHTTRDVVRQAVIPATRSSGEAYATQVAQGRARVRKAFLKFAVSLEVPYLNPFLVPSSTVGGFWVETRDLMQLLEGATLLAGFEGKPKAGSRTTVLGFSVLVQTQQ